MLSTPVLLPPVRLPPAGEPEPEPELLTDLLLLPLDPKLLFPLDPKPPLPPPPKRSLLDVDRNLCMAQVFFIYT